MAGRKKYASMLLTAKLIASSHKLLPGEKGLICSHVSVNETVALQLNRLVERTQHHTSSSAMFQLPPGAIPSISACPILAAQPKVVSSTRHTQPLTSILKPATLSLPGGGQTLTLGAAGGGGEVKGAVPVQFVLPPPPQAMGSTVTSDSREYY